MAVTKKKGSDESIERIELTREQLRSDARNRLGVTGADEKPVPLIDVIKKHQLSLYPLFALGILSIVDTFQSYAFQVLAPEMSATLGISRGAIAGVLAINTLAAVVGPLPVAALTQQRARRALIIVTTGILWSVIAISTGFVTAIGGLLLVLVLDGLTTASVRALHTPFLLDSYPPEGRVRALSYYQATNSFGNVLAPILVFVCVTTLGLTWRGVFVALGLLSLGAAFTASRLRDPGYGRWDSEQIRATVRQKEQGLEAIKQEGLSESDVSLGFFEIVRRAMLIPTIRRVLVVQTVFGILLIPLQTFLIFFLDERWNLDADQRAVFTAYRAVVAIGALAVFGKRAEALYRKSPVKVIELTSVLLIASIGALCVGALVPSFLLVIVLFGVSTALLAPLAPALNIAVLSVIPSGMRPHAAALIGIFTAVGGIVGALFLGGIDAQWGITGTIVSMIIPGTLAAVILRTAAPLVPQDLDRMIDETLEDEEVRQLNAAGETLPMLACRKVNFSYDQVQVLFDVDFTVEDGEMVALLGTNGAGKSTLLKVISGIGLPFLGSVRYRGLDITYLDAERRLKLGITQIPGGRAVFAPLDVVENLKVFGHTLGRNRKEVDDAIERSLEAFPRLRERQHQKASTLSGGEQQMLGLAKALILRPKLLLVDELSLGLAPVIVGQLLDMVREINNQGTAVVLVEQSVNIALNLCEHAYFMEKGEIRFDGKSRDLLRRDDLLRAVFLEGASAQTAPRKRR